MKIRLSSPRVISLAIALAVFAVYLRTLAATVDFIDAGELTTVAYTLGIAHPTGYPLFSLLGWIFSHLPLSASVVVRMNVMAAFFCAAGIFFYFHIVYFLLTTAMTGGDRRATPRGEEFSLLAASAGAALLLAFSETYWSQAVAVEVYSLHLFLVSVVMWTFLKANYPSGDDARRKGRWLLFAFALGICFTNHMTTILLAPGFLYLYFAEQGRGAASWKRILAMVPPFLAGLSLYCYLPIRGMQSPVMNWGNPVTLERFFWHVSGKQFRVWLFSSGGAAAKQFSYFVDSLPGEFAYVGLVLATVGVIVLWRAHRRLAIWSILLFVFCVAYSINYDIHDIDSYFLLAYVVMAVWSGCAFWAFARWVYGRAPAGRTVAAAGILACALVPLFVLFPGSDESGNTLVEDYTANMFSSLKPDAVILSTQWDFWVSAAYYFQLVEGRRTDVAVIDKELLRRSWYYLQLEHRFPWLIRQSRAEVDAFLAELDKFEHDMPRSTYLPIQDRYVGMIRSFIAKNIGSRPVYVTWEIERELTEGYQKVPEGLAFRLYADTLFHPSEMPAFTYRPYTRRGRLEDLTRQMYAMAFTSRGEYYAQKGHLPADARASFLTATSYDNEYAPPRRWLQMMDRLPPRPEP